MEKADLRAAQLLKSKLSWGPLLVTFPRVPVCAGTRTFWHTRTMAAIMRVCVCMCVRAHMLVFSSLISASSGSQVAAGGSTGLMLSWSYPVRKREPLCSNIPSEGSELA